MRIIISSHSALTGSTRLGDITSELNRIYVSGRLPRRSGWLLAVLHTTRALDTTLSEILLFKGWNPNGQSRNLGSHLHKLKDNAVLTQTQRRHYQTKVVDERNKYMHQAGAIPGKVEADAILAEMDACITHVLGQVLPCASVTAQSQATGPGIATSAAPFASTNCRRARTKPRRIVSV